MAVLSEKAGMKSYIKLDKNKRYYTSTPELLDIIEADASISDELKQEIEKDGVTIYEKTR